MRVNKLHGVEVKIAEDIGGLMRTENRKPVLWSFMDNHHLYVTSTVFHMMKDPSGFKIISKIYKWREPLPVYLE